ncbi:MAG: hypothetical protein ACYTDY_02965 [Planctomycetota bacterium]|jgi:hypothetical protein
MSDDDMGGVPPPRSRFGWKVPWGIVFLLALVPLGALLALLFLGGE